MFTLDFVFKTNGRALASEPKCFNLGFKHPPVSGSVSPSREMLQIFFPSVSAHAQKSLNDTKSGSLTFMRKNVKWKHY